MKNVFYLSLILAVMLMFCGMGLAQEYDLNVESDGADGVAISSTTGHDGTTDYTIEDIPEDTEINLEAPAVDPGDFTFIRWTIGGANQPLQQKSITFDLTEDTTAIAVYAAPYTLTVQSTPTIIYPACAQPLDPPVIIITSSTGHGGVLDHDEDNEYTHEVDHFDLVNLEAPASDPYAYTFVRWTVNGEDRPDGQKNITINIEEAVTAVAVYELNEYNVYVMSTPVPNQLISSTTGHGGVTGTTDYPRTINHFDSLNLEAPLVDAPAGRTQFSRWEINGDLKPPGHEVYQISCYAHYFPIPEGDLFATAIFEFPFYGTIWTWGINEHAQLGDGSMTDRTRPVQTDSGSDGDVALSGGMDHSLGLRGDGRVYAWGRNNYGQIGDGTNVNRPTPVQVPGLSGVVDVATGRNHSLALRGNGLLYAWGNNEYGQLGNGYTGDENSPQIVMEQLWEPAFENWFDNVIAVDAGYFHSLALRGDGSVWAWGRNNDGQVGDGTTTSRYLPRQVISSGAVAIAAGDFHSMALMADGTVRAWGNNQYGQLGDRTTTNRLTPTPVLVSLHTLNVSSTPRTGISISSVTGHGGTTSYSVAAAGDNPVSLTAPASYIHVDEDDGETTEYEFRRWRLNGVGQTVGNATLAFVINQNTTAEAVYNIVEEPPDDGDDENGGDEENGIESDSPVFTLDTTQISGVAGISAGAFHSVLRKDDGSVFTWGRNDFGQLGIGSAGSKKSAPTKVTGIGAMVDIAAGGYHTLALRGDGYGAVWAWGKNTNGQLGDGTTTHRTSPIRIPGVDLISAISAGIDHSLAIQPAAGFVWGRNSGYSVYARRGVNLGSPGGVGWLNYPGALSHVSVGSDRIWGVNRSGSIYFRESIMFDNVPWEWVLGYLNQISVGPNGDVWGVQTWSGNIYLRSGVTVPNPTGTGWTRIPGALSYVSVGTDGVWGINPSGRIYYRDSVINDGTPWINVPGILRRISIGPTGAVWGVNPSGYIYVRMGITGGNPIGTHWQQVPGRLVDIAVGDGIVWGINASGYVYYRLGVDYNAGHWIRVPGLLRQIDVAGTGIPGPAPVAEYPYIQPQDSPEPEEDAADESCCDYRGETWSSETGDVNESVVKRPPVAIAGGDREVKAGRVVRFNGGESYAPDGEIVSYEWDMTGNGIYDSYGERVSKSFDSSGIIYVTLRVTDDNGAADTDTVKITVID